MSPELEVVVDGLAFGESVRWHEGRIWYCDWIDGDVLSVDPDGGHPVTHAHVDGFPVCIDWDRHGRLLVVAGGAKQLQRVDADGLTVVADLSTSSDRPWNEVVGHPAGQVYINGIGFDMMAGEPAAMGQIALVDEAGEVRTVADDLAFPNGMALDPAGTVLVVAESHAGRITAYTVAPSGELVDRRSFAEVLSSAPDGICFAPDGTLWYADVPNRHCRRVAEGGSIVETVEVDRGCFSCAVGPDGDLYIAATIWDDQTFATRRGVLYRRPG